MILIMEDYIVTQFEGDEQLASKIASLHLGVREWQVQQGQARFTKGILSSQEDLKELRKRYIDQGGNFFLANNKEGDIVGFLAIRNDGDGLGVVKRVAVLPDHQRKGIASKLLEEAINWSIEQGYSKLKLSTGLREKGKPLYEKFGFKVVGRDETNEDYLMELELVQSRSLNN